MVAPSFLFALGFRLSLTRSGIERESGAGPHPRVARGVVVGVAVVVAIADVGRRTTHDGAKPPIDANNKAQPLRIIAARLVEHHGLKALRLGPRGGKPVLGGLLADDAGVLALLGDLVRLVADHA